MAIPNLLVRVSRALEVCRNYSAVPLTNCSSNSDSDVFLGWGFNGKQVETIQTHLEWRSLMAQPWSPPTLGELRKTERKVALAEPESTPATIGFQKDESIELASMMDRQRLSRNIKQPVSKRDEDADGHLALPLISIPSKPKDSTSPRTSPSVESSDTDKENLWRLVKELKEENRRLNENYARDVNDWKEEKQRLWAMIEGLMVKH